MTVEECFHTLKNLSEDRQKDREVAG